MPYNVVNNVFEPHKIKVVYKDDTFTELSTSNNEIIIRNMRVMIEPKTMILWAGNADSGLEFYKPFIIGGKYKRKIRVELTILVPVVDAAVAYNTIQVLERIFEDRDVLSNSVDYVLWNWRIFFPEANGWAYPKMKPVRCNIEAGRMRTSVVSFRCEFTVIGYSTTW